METAAIIVQMLELDGFRRSKLLREVTPTALPGRRVPYAKRRLATYQLDGIVERYFRPSRIARHEVLVCHGNLIRSLVCRVLGARSNAWLQLGTLHCNVTTIAVAPDGAFYVVRFSESAHLPAELQTTS